MSPHVSFLVQGTHLASCARSQLNEGQIRAVTLQVRGQVTANKACLGWVLWISRCQDESWAEGEGVVPALQGSGRACSLCQVENTAMAEGVPEEAVPREGIIRRDVLPGGCSVFRVV